MLGEKWRDKTYYFFTFLQLCPLPCSSRISLAGMPLRRCLLVTTRWATFPITTKERWTCMPRLSPGLWGWTWLDSLRPGVGPSKQPLKRISPPCLPGVTTPWLSMTECPTAADGKWREMGSMSTKLLPFTIQWEIQLINFLFFFVCCAFIVFHILCIFSNETGVAYFTRYIQLELHLKF